MKGSLIPLRTNTPFCSIMQILAIIMGRHCMLWTNNEPGLWRLFSSPSFTGSFVIILSLYVFSRCLPSVFIYCRPVSISTSACCLWSSFTASLSPPFSLWWDAFAPVSHSLLAYSIMGFPKKRKENTICILDHVCDARGKRMGGEEGLLKSQFEVV